MRIRAVRLSGAGPFVSGVALEGLSGALDVLSGPNELGKSTLFHGLEAVFLAKHTRGGEWLEKLKSRGAAMMTIEADFEASGVSWRILKRFGRGATAELTSLATGRLEARRQEADERLAELIGSHPDEPGRLGLLWVGQGRGLTPAVPDEGKDRGERSVLMAAIEREIETVAGGAEARLVRERVARMLDEQTTPANRERARKNSPLEQAESRRDKLSQELAVARQNAEQTAARRDELARLRERLLIIDNPGARALRSERIGMAEAALAAASAAVAELKAAQAARNEKAQALDSAEAALQTYDRRVQEQTEIAVLQDSEKARLAALTSTLREANTALDSSRARLENLEDEVRGTAQRVAALRAGAARKRLDAAQAIEIRIREIETEIAANPATVAAMQSLEREERAIGLIEARLSAAAPRVRINYAEGGEGRLRVAGKAIADRAVLKADGPLEIEIEGIGRMTITPGTSEDAGEDRNDLAAHRCTLEAGLVALGVPSMAEARRRASEREAADLALRDAKARRAGIAPEGLAALTREAERTFATAEPDTAPILDESEALADAEAAQSDARRRLDAARAALSKEDAACAAIRVEAGRFAARIEATAQRLAAIEARLPPPAVRVQERARLANAAEAAARQAREAARTLDMIQKSVPAPAALDRLGAEREAARREGLNADGEISELRQQAARIEGALEEADEKGTGIEVDRLLGELARAEAEVRRHRARVASLALLENVLGEAEAAARDRFLAPVTARLDPFLSLAFPEARLVLGEHFSVTALERHGISETIDVLSQGTQEQIAVLVRCAFGRLLAEAGTPVPLILDDALVYSDDQRIARMFSALALAAQSHQVLVLTCRERTFATLGGHRLSLVPWTA